MNVSWPTVVIVAIVAAFLTACIALKASPELIAAIGGLGTIAAGLLEKALSKKPSDGDPPQPPARRPPPGFMGVMMFVLVFAAVDCRPATAPAPDADAATSYEEEAGVAIANVACSLIDGIDDSGAVRTICADVPEIAQIVSFITMLRSADAGAPTVRAACELLPGTDFCATSSERAKAILFVVRARMARVSLEAGAPLPAFAGDGGTR